METPKDELNFLLLHVTMNANRMQPSCAHGKRPTEKYNNRDFQLLFIEPLN